MNMCTCGYNGSTLFQGRYNPGNSFRRTGRQGDNWFSAFTERGTPHKIHLSTYPRILIGPDCVRTNLTGNINFYRAIDSYHAWIAPNDMRVVYIINIQKLESWVI